MMRQTALALSLCAGIASCAPTNVTGPTAQIKNGTLQGVYSPEYDQDFFLGIPYAQPPVGSLRFRTPVALNESWSGAKPATQYSSAVSGMLVTHRKEALLIPSSAMDMEVTSGATQSRRTASTSMLFVQPDVRTRSSPLLSGSTEAATSWEVVWISATTRPSRLRTP
jgi:hypothetical protein